MISDGDVGWYCRARNASRAGKGGKRSRAGVMASRRVADVLSTRVHVLDYDLGVGAVVGPDGSRNASTSRRKNCGWECDGVKIGAFSLTTQLRLKIQRLDGVWNAHLRRDLERQ